MGGRGSYSSGGENSVSNLTKLKENSRQFNHHAQEAMKAGASVYKFTDISGKTHTRYREGNRWADRPNSMEAVYGGAHGEYKATFQTPKDWKTTRKRG